MIALTKERIDQAFEAAETQADWVLDLYRYAIEDDAGRPWDDVQRLHGWPEIGPETSRYIMGRAMAFDQKHHPGVMPGGLWMNNGFRASQDVPEWHVTTRNVEIV